MSLADERCGACGPGTPHASDAERAAWSAELPGWTVADGRLVRALTLPDFASAYAHVAAIAAIAEAEGHHPDLAFGWGYLRVSVHTHAVRGLTRADFVLAAKIARALG